MIHCGVCVSGWYGAGATLKHRQPARSATCYPQKILRYASRAAGALAVSGMVSTRDLSAPDPQGGVRFFRIDPLDRKATIFSRRQIMKLACFSQEDRTSCDKILETGTKFAKMLVTRKEFQMLGLATSSARIVVSGSCALRTERCGERRARGREQGK